MASTSFLHLPYRPRTSADRTAPAGRRRLAWLTVVLLLSALFAPGAGATGSTAAVDPIEQARQQRDEIRRKQAELAAQIDLVKASDDEVAAALNAIDQDVSAQDLKVSDARKAVEDADRRAEELKAELAANEAEVGRIEDEVRKRAIDQYVNPEGNNDTEQLLHSSDFDQAERRKALANAVTGNSHDAIDQLKGAKARLADLQLEVADARTEADNLRVAEQAQLDKLQVARDEQAKVKAEWDKRLAGLHDNAAELNSADAELTQFIQAEQARRAAAEQAAREKAAREAAARAAAQQQAEANARAQAAARTTQSAAAKGTTAAASGSSGGSAPAPSTGSGGSSGGRMIWPINGRVSQEFGVNGHPGIDIFAPSGTPIYAAKAGTVIYAQFNNGGYGNLVVVDHGNGLSTAYAHQSQIIVSVGQSVGQGQQLGLEGSTGHSTGPHLHFEVRVNGSVQNPRNYLA